MEFKIFGATLKLNSTGDLLGAMAFAVVLGLSLLSFGWLPQFAGFAYAADVKKGFDDAAKEREQLRDQVTTTRNMLEMTIINTNKDTLALIVRGNIIGMKTRECELRRAKNFTAADVLAEVVSDLQAEYHMYKGVDYPVRGC